VLDDGRKGERERDIEELLPLAPAGPLEVGESDEDDSDPWR
jgi:hypothetical protein